MRKNRLLKVCDLARVVLIVVGFACSASAFGETFIVKDGQPQAEIVVSKDAPRMAKLAAEELQTYLEKISGAKLSIANAPGKDVPVQIYVGRSADTDRLKITDEGLKNGAFRMVSGKNYLVLLGHDSDYTPKEPHLRNHGDMARLMADWDKVTGEKWGFPLANLHKQYSGSMKIWEKDERGSLNAVYEFLRMQGVRWYVPDPIGEIVPEKKSIALPEIDKTVRPDFAMRFPYQYFRMFSHEGTTRDELLWQLRLGLSQAPEVMGEHEMAGGHGINHVHSRNEIKKTHPEYFALFGDKRETGPYAGAPCLSSEGLFQQNVKYVRAMFDLYDAPMVSVMPEDGYGTLCQCELCKGKGTPERGWNGQLSDYVWDYVNRVGKEVYKTHPNKKISCLAYGSYELPPLKIDKLSPNIVVGIAQGRTNFHDPEKFNNAVALRKSWLAKLPDDHAPIWIWEYYLHNRPRSPYGSIPVFFPHTIAKDLRSLKGISIGDFLEMSREQQKGISELAVDHLNLYVTARLWWNADENVDAVLNEYYTLFYGPAAKEMKTFIEYSEANWPLMAKKVEPIDKAFELLAAARTAAGDTIYGKRIAWIQDYMEPMKQLRVKLAEGRKNVPKAEALRRDQKDIVINGKLDDKFWKGLPIYALNDVESGKTPVNGGSFQVGYTGDALFLGITCKDSDMKNIKISTTKNGDANIWSGDNVEVLLETPVHSYYQLTIGPSGALMNMDRKNGFNTLWVSHADVATYRGDDFWSIEMRLPVAGELQEQLDPLNGIAGNIPSDKNPWFFNVCRLRVRGDEQEFTAFAPAGKRDFHVLLKFAELKGR